MIERICFRRHRLRGVLSTALGPQELLSLERQDVRLCLAGMSPEPVWSVARPRLTAPPEGPAGMPGLGQGWAISND
jgi:hypothetical protein